MLEKSVFITETTKHAIYVLYTELRDVHMQIYLNETQALFDRAWNKKCAKFVSCMSNLFNIDVLVLASFLHEEAE